MERAGAAEREKVGAWLGNAQRFDPELLAWYAVVPPLAHEVQAVGRVGHDGVDAVGIHGTHGVAAVGVDE